MYLTETWRVFTRSDVVLINTFIPIDSAAGVHASPFTILWHTSSLWYFMVRESNDVVNDLQCLWNHKSSWMHDTAKEEKPCA
jgi:hypothetical protein